jgi:hypothetical protein
MCNGFETEPRFLYARVRATDNMWRSPSQRAGTITLQAMSQRLTATFVPRDDEIPVASEGATGHPRLFCPEFQCGRAQIPNNSGARELTDSACLHRCAMTITAPTRIWIAPCERLPY